MAKETEIERLIVRMVGDATSYQKMLRDSQQASRRTATAVERAGKRIEAISQRLRAFGAGVYRWGRRATMALTGVASGALYAFSQVDTALSRMRGLVGLSAQEVVYLRTEMEKLVREGVGKSLAELSDAMFFITSGGLRGAEAVAALRQSAMSSTAGLGDLASVADAVTSAMNTYGPANLDATRATEVLTAAVRAGKAEAASFAPVLGQVLPMANELGVTFDQVAGSMAFLTKSTGNASMAATGIRGIFTKLSVVTKQTEEALDAAGMSIDEVRRSVRERGLLTTLVELRRRLESSGVEFTKVFSDVEGLNAALQLTGPQARDAANVMAQVASSVGIVDEAFNAAAGTIGFKWKDMLDQGKLALTNLGEALAPAAAQVTEWMRTFNAAVSGGLKPIQEAWIGLTHVVQVSMLKLQAWLTRTWNRIKTDTIVAVLTAHDFVRSLTGDTKADPRIQAYRNLQFQQDKLAEARVKKETDRMNAATARALRAIQGGRQRAPAVQQPNPAQPGGGGLFDAYSWVMKTVNSLRDKLENQPKIKLPAAAMPVNLYPTSQGIQAVRAGTAEALSRDLEGRRLFTKRDSGGGSNPLVSGALTASNVLLGTAINKLIESGIIDRAVAAIENGANGEPAGIAGL